MNYRTNPLYRVLSYVKDIPLETVNSEVSGQLEVYLSNGVIRLNSERANYSFGSLHRAFAKTFRKLDFRRRHFEKVLILGYGFGSVEYLLRRKYHLGPDITGIEIDPVVISLYHKYYGNPFSNTMILVEDARQFMQNTHQKYDLIVVDIYVDRDVPKAIEGDDFIRSLFNTLDQRKSMLIFNKFVYNDQTGIEAADLLKRMKAISPSCYALDISELFVNTMIIYET